MGTPELSPKQGAVGPRGSGGTINHQYSAGETLKAPVSSEGRNNVLLWYLLVGVLVGLSTGASGCWGWAQVVRRVLSAASTNVDKWLGRGTGVTAPTYPGPGNCHILEAGTWVGGEQARPVKTVKVQHALAGATGSDRRYSGGSIGPSGDRYRLGHRPVMDFGLWLNVQSGHSKLATSVGPGELCRCDRVWAEKAHPGSSGPCRGSSRAGKLGLWMHLQLGVARKAPTRRYL